MVKRIDQRPTGPGESIKRLLERADNKQTVPFGQKVASSDEGVNFFASDGVSHRWDGDTIKEYDARIAAGEEAIAQANEKLAQAQAELDAAKERIDAAGGDLSVYIEKVDSATKAVADAKASMSALESRLGTAEAKTNTVAGSITTVQGALSALDSQVATQSTQIQQAEAKASEASDKAINALQASQAVQANADNAVAVAEKAQRDALAAAGVANGKGKIIFSSSAPASADEREANLWVKLPANTPHRWDGSAWVVVSDQAVADAAISASTAKATADKAVADAKTAKDVADQAVANAKTAQSTADTAKADAKAAQGTADKAVADASTAKSVADKAVADAKNADTKALEAAGIANGKGKVIYSSTAPTGADRATQNLWINTATNAPARWNGTAWVVITDKVATDAATAASRAQAQADTAKSDAAKAQATADKAMSDAQAAQSSANHAQSTADTANTAASRAQAQADTAKSDAAKAQSTADKAVSDASGAKATAEKAVADAQAAQAQADTANAKALEASGIAGGKGKVIFSPTAPTGADRLPQNLWIRSTDNKPHTWNGSTWVAATDKAALDAASAASSAKTAADTAQTTANKAVADASKAQAQADKAVADASKAQSTADQAIKDAQAAATTAQQANIAAGNAQKTADGKSVNSYGITTPPPAPGVAKGDRYSVIGTDQRITEQWEWDGAKWVKRSLDSAQLVNFDAAYITSGYLDVTKRIQAGSVHADKLFVGIGDNLLPPLKLGTDMRGVPEGWAGNNGISGDVSITVPASTGMTGTYISSIWGGDYLIPIEPGTSYRVSAWAKTETPSTAQQMVYVRFVQSDTGGWSFGNRSTAFASVGTDWTELSAVFSPPNTELRYDRMLIGFYTQAGHNSPVTFSSPTIREMKHGELIVNGTITGDKINANSVAATVGNFVQVKADNVEVTQDFSARVAQVMDLTAKKLIVTDQAILNHATLIGNTVVEHLNVTKKLVARDAVIDGTLDVAQLNVTGGMAAAIVDAMDVNAKKLVVTEDAILNRLTVIQDIVTPELIAEKVNVKELGARIITTGALQTSELPNTGVKIDSTGYKAYDENGALSVEINGKSNRLIGTFATSNADSSGVKISQGSTSAAIDLYTPNWGGNATYKDSHAGIWYEVPGTLRNRGLQIVATDSKNVSLTDPGLRLRPALGYGFQGNMSADSPGSKAGKFEDKAGIPAGSYKDYNFPFLTPMSMQSGGMVMVVPSIVNANKNETAFTVFEDNANGFGLRIVNLVGTRATGTVWIKWIAIVL